MCVCVCLCVCLCVCVCVCVCVFEHHRGCRLTSAMEKLSKRPSPTNARMRANSTLSTTGVETG